MLAALALVASLSAPLPPAYAGACQTGRARYVLRHDSKITLGFRRYRVRPKGILTDVYLFLHSSHTGKTYWFEMDWGSSPIINVYPVENPDTRPNPAAEVDEKAPPYDNMTLWSADAALNFAVQYPEAKAPAPKYILIPELQNAMWYGAEPREAVPTAFFILKSCAGN